MWILGGEIALSCPHDLIGCAVYAIAYITCFLWNSLEWLWFGKEADDQLENESYILDDESTEAKDVINSSLINK